MSELEDEIVKTKDEIKSDEAKIATLKSGLWQKKKGLKALEEALAIINGIKTDKDSGDNPAVLETII